MNILVLCDHGQVRSVSMASVLRERGHFAVAGSYDNYVQCISVIEFEDGSWGEYNIIENGEFFDRIIYMQEGGEHFIGKYGSCDHPELIANCKELANKLGL